MSCRVPNLNTEFFNTRPPPRLTLQNTVRTDTLSRAVDPERKINISRQGSVEQKSHVCKVGKEKETGWFAVEAVKS